MGEIFQRNKLELFAKIKYQISTGKTMNVNRKSFFVMSFAKEELTIELTTVDCSLRPKK